MIICDGENLCHCAIGTLGISLSCLKSSFVGFRMLLSLQLSACRTLIKLDKCLLGIFSTAPLYRVTFSPRWESIDQNWLDCWLWRRSIVMMRQWVCWWLCVFSHIRQRYQLLHSPIKCTRRRFYCRCPNYSIGSWVNLDDSSVRPLHGGHAILSDTDQRSLLDRMLTARPFGACG